MSEVMERTPATQLDLSGVSIGYVEDDPNVHEATVGKLRLRGCNVYSLVSKNDVLRFAETNDHPVCLVLDIDLGLGKKNAGIRISREVKVRYPQVFIILLSAYISDKNEMILGTSNADFYLSKSELGRDVDIICKKCSELLKSTVTRNIHAAIASEDTFALLGSEYMHSAGNAIRLRKLADERLAQTLASLRTDLPKFESESPLSDNSSVGGEIESENFFASTKNDEESTTLSVSDLFRRNNFTLYESLIDQLSELSSIQCSEKPTLDISLEDLLSISVSRIIHLGAPRISMALHDAEAFFNELDGTEVTVPLIAELDSASASSVVGLAIYGASGCARSIGSEIRIERDKAILRLDYLDLIDPDSTDDELFNYAKGDELDSVAFTIDLSVLIILS